ncbi:MAG: hypothetical protein NC048_10320 [Bacteroides sp.]|nr:hypothetical protein [Bacteroides sp.]
MASVQRLEPAPLFPHYDDGIRIPCNIAPLNFVLPDTVRNALVKVSSSSARKTFRIRQKMAFPLKFWHELTLAARQGKTDTIRISMAVRGSSKTYFRYPVLHWIVCPDTIDPYLTYRLVQPTAGAYNVIELRERCLQDFDEKVLMNNQLMDGNCFNCHTYDCGEADRMMIHLRKPSEGSLFFDRGELQKVRLPEAEKVLAHLPDSLRMPLNFVYAAWHPDGKYIAFCTNILGISGYAAHRQYMNLLDSASNILLYDPQERSVSLPDALWTAAHEETWPTWSPDGKWLYFCRTPKVSPDTVARYPEWGERVQHIWFDLCRVAFDAGSGTFSDTVQTVLASRPGQSFSVPRVHPDGRHLLLCRSLYNSVPYQSEGDLLLLDLQNLTPDAESGANPAETLNSPESESWHEWSANGRWVVFGSKRQDGHYTLPYIAHFDGKEFGKPFVLPQKSARFYQTNLRSFNLPTFTRNASTLTPQKAAAAKRSPALGITVK